jgi:hypothetical protein
MAYTLLGNVYVPLHFMQEIQQITAVKSALWRSGIIVGDAALAGKARQGGRLVEMPYWDDLTGNSEPINSGTTLTVNNITSDKMQAYIAERGKAWGAETIAGILAQGDPMAAIQNRVADWWIRDNQDTLISTLKGMFGAASMSGLLSAIHHTSGGAGSYDESNTFNANTAILAAQLLGDSKDNLTAYVMHSAVEASLAMDDLIETIPASESRPRVRLFQGKPVIMDDRCPTSTVDGDTVYTTYLFGYGAFAYEEDMSDRNVPGIANGSWYFEEGRVSLQDLSHLITRKRYLLHPFGMKWTDSDSDTSPTNAQLETAANWQRKYEVKNMRIAAITHNVDLTPR